MSSRLQAVMISSVIDARQNALALQDNQDIIE
jgi:hypothetical protein